MGYMANYNDSHCHICGSDVEERIEYDYDDFVGRQNYIKSSYECSECGHSHEVDQMEDSISICEGGEDHKYKRLKGKPLIREYKKESVFPINAPSLEEGKIRFINHIKGVVMTLSKESSSLSREEERKYLERVKEARRALVSK